MFLWWQSLSFALFAVCLGASSSSANSSSIQKGLVLRPCCVDDSASSVQHHSLSELPWQPTCIASKTGKNANTSCESIYVDVNQPTYAYLGWRINVVTEPHQRSTSLRRVDAPNFTLELHCGFRHPTQHTPLHLRTAYIGVCILFVLPLCANSSNYSKLHFQLHVSTIR